MRHQDWNGRGCDNEGFIVAFTIGQDTPRKMVVFLLKKKNIFYLSNDQVYSVLRRVLRYGHGFESRHLVLDEHFSHIFVVKICNVCLGWGRK